MLVCLIPSTYVGMHSPASGPAVLICHLSICQGLTQKSGLWYMSSIWLYAGHAKSKNVGYNLNGLHQHPICSQLESNWRLQAKSSNMQKHITQQILPHKQMSIIFAMKMNCSIAHFCCAWHRSNSVCCLHALWWYHFCCCCYSIAVARWYLNTSLWSE